MSGRPNPYVGPRAFDTGEKLYGRDVEVRRLFELLVSERIVLLYSPSGAGKSSLIRAGLIPLLKQEGFEVFDIARVNQEPDSVTTGNRYIKSMMLSIDAGVPPEAHTASEGQSAPNLGDIIAKRPKPTDGSDMRVMIIDQFEEILTTAPNDKEGKQAFFQQLGEALRDPLLWVLCAMREDYLGGLDPYLRPVPTRFAHTFRLDFLSISAALEAVQSPPLETYGVPFTQAAATKLVDDLRTVQVQQPDGTTVEEPGPIIEPVQLQVACFRLWENLAPDDMEIGEDDLASVGNVDESLAQYYQESVETVTKDQPSDERRVREWFGNELIRGGRRYTVRKDQESSGGLENSIIEALRNTHLVRAEQRAGATWYELAHDRLIEPILKNNTAWFQRHLSLLQRQAALWDEQDRPAGLLLQGQALSDAVKWAAGQLGVESRQVPKSLAALASQFHQPDLAPKEAIPCGDLTTAEVDFLLACQEAQQQRQRARRGAQTMAVLGAVALVLAILAFLAWRRSVDSAAEASRQQNIAEREASRAKVQEQIAVNKEAEANNQRQIAEANAAEARQQKIQADANAAEAEVQRKNAEANAMEAEIQRKAAEASAAEALTQAAIARSGLLAAQSESSNPGFPERALLLAIESYDLAKQAGQAAIGTARQALLAALKNSGSRVLTTHENAINAILFHPTLPLVVTASTDGDAHLVNISALLEKRALDPTALPVILDGHERAVVALAISPDKRWLATGGVDKTIRLWDMKALAEVPPGENVEAQFILEGHTDGVRGLAFSPDGRWLISNGSEPALLLWDMKSILAAKPSAAVEPPAPGATQVYSQTLVLAEPPKQFNQIAFSPDGRWFAGAGGEQIARVWDVRDFSKPASFSTLAPSETITPTTAVSPTLLGPVPYSLVGHQGAIGALKFSPDSRWLVTGSNDDTARLWKLSSLLEFGKNDVISSTLTLAGSQGDITSIDISPDDHWLAAGSRDAQVRLWDFTKLQADLASAPDPTEMPSPAAIELRGHSDRILKVIFSPDSHWLATTSADNSTRLWDLSSPDAPPTILQGHRGLVNDLAFSPDSAWLATGGADNRARIWDILKPTAGIAVLRGHNAAINSVAFSPTVDHIASGDRKGVLKLWDATPFTQTGLENPIPIPTRKQEQTSAIRRVIYAPSGAWIVSVGDDKAVRVWDAKAPNDAPRIFREHKDQVWSAAISPNEKYLASGGRDGEVILWNFTSLTSSGQPVFTRLPKQHSGPIRWLEFSPDSRWIASASEDGFSRAWDTANPTADPVELAALDKAIYTAVFSPDGRWIVNTSYDRSVRIWDAARLSVGGVQENNATILLQQCLDGKPIHANKIRAAAFSPDGRWLATGGDDNTIRIWDFTALTQEPDSQADPCSHSQVLRGHDGFINQVLFSPTGSWLASASKDGTARVWDLAAIESSGDINAVVTSIVLPDHSDDVTSLAFTQDGQTLATSSLDATVRLWLLDADFWRTLACQEAGRNLTAAEWAQYFIGIEPKKTCEEYP